jgi:hypothetical protein
MATSRQFGGAHEAGADAGREGECRTTTEAGAHPERVAGPPVEDIAAQRRDHQRDRESGRSSRGAGWPATATADGSRSLPRHLLDDGIVRGHGSRSIQILPLKCAKLRSHLVRLPRLRAVQGASPIAVHGGASLSGCAGDLSALQPAGPSAAAIATAVVDHAGRQCRDLLARLRSAGSRMRVDGVRRSLGRPSRVAHPDPLGRADPAVRRPRRPRPGRVRARRTVDRDPRVPTAPLQDRGTGPAVGVGVPLSGGARAVHRRHAAHPGRPGDRVRRHQRRRGSQLLGSAPRRQDRRDTGPREPHPPASPPGRAPMAECAPSSAA